MDTARLIRSVLWFVVGLMLGGTAAVAWADYPAVWTSGWAGVSDCFPTIQEACADACGRYGWPVYQCQPGENGNICGDSPGGPNGTREYREQCRATCPYGGTLEGATCVGADPTCPSGQSWNGTACVSQCPTGQTWNGSECVLPCPPAGTVNTGASGGFVSKNACSGINTSACVGGCRVDYDFGGWNGAGTKCSWGGTARNSGQSCTSAQFPAPAGTSDQPSTCPVGQCPGTVNGVGVCVSCSSGTSKTTSTTTATNADGSTTSTTRTTTSTSSGTGVDSTTTTTTTTTPAGGGTPTTSTTTRQSDQPASSFCEENPQSPLCKQSSFGGSCGAFSCDGDAIQCAIAREQHQRDCKLFDEQTALSQLGDQVAAGNDPMASQYPTASGQVQTVNLAGSLNQTEIFTASCIADFNFTIAGKAVHVPMDAACQWAGWIGNLMVMATLVAGMMIVGKG